MGQAGFTPTPSIMDNLDTKPAISDEEFGALLFKQSGDRLFDFAYALTRDYDIASSIVESVIIQVAQQKDFGSSLTVLQWLYSDSCEAAFEWLANNRRLSPESRVTKLDAPPAIITRADQSAMLWQAVSGFGERDQAMIALHIRHQMELKSIGRILGFGSAAVEMMLEMCLERVDSWLGALLLLDYLVQNPEAAIPSRAEPLLESINVWDGHFTPLVHQKTAEFIKENDLISWRDSVVPKAQDLLAEQALTPAPYQILHVVREKLQSLSLLETMPPPPQPAASESMADGANGVAGAAEDNAAGLSAASGSAVANGLGSGCAAGAVGGSGSRAESAGGLAMSASGAVDSPGAGMAGSLGVSGMTGSSGGSVGAPGSGSVGGPGPALLPSKSAVAGSSIPGVPGSSMPGAAGSSVPPVANDLGSGAALGVSGSSVPAIPGAAGSSVPGAASVPGIPGTSGSHALGSDASGIDGLGSNAAMAGLELAPGGAGSSAVGSHAPGAASAVGSGGASSGLTDQRSENTGESVANPSGELVIPSIVTVSNFPQERSATNANETQSAHDEAATRDFTETERAELQAALQAQNASGADGRSANQTDGVPPQGGIGPGGKPLQPPKRRNPNHNTAQRIKQRHRLAKRRLRKRPSLKAVIQAGIVSGLVLVSCISLVHWYNDPSPTAVPDPTTATNAHGLRVPGKLIVQDGPLEVENGVETSMVIANTGGTAVDWKVVEKPDWITVAVSSGSLPPGKIAAIDVSKISNIHEGTQKGNIKLQWDGISSGDVEVPIETTVVNPPIIGTFVPEKTNITSCDESINVTVEAGDETGVSKVEVQTFIPGTEVKFVANLEDSGPIDQGIIPKLPVGQPGASIAQSIDNGHLWQGTIGPFSEAGTYSVAVIAQDKLGASIEANRGQITVAPCEQ